MKEKMVLLCLLWHYCGGKNPTWNLYFNMIFHILEWRIWRMSSCCLLKCMKHKSISSQTLQKDASDYEKTEFLKEAHLMRWKTCLLSASYWKYDYNRAQCGKTNDDNEAPWLGANGSVCCCLAFLVDDSSQK